MIRFLWFTQGTAIRVPSPTAEDKSDCSTPERTTVWHRFPAGGKILWQKFEYLDTNYQTLEQLWCQSDFEHIKTVTGYRFGHYFKTSCVAGTSGLAIFAKWAPETIHFEPYTVNGSPFKPHHGDWFAGKGVAYVRIDLSDLRLHLFCTHVSIINTTISHVEFPWLWMTMHPFLIFIVGFY